MPKLNVNSEETDTSTKEPMMMTSRATSDQNGDVI